MRRKAGRAWLLLLLLQVGPGCGGSTGDGPSARADSGPGSLSDAATRDLGPASADSGPAPAPDATRDLGPASADGGPGPAPDAGAAPDSGPGPAPDAGTPPIPHPFEVLFQPGDWAAAHLHHRLDAAPWTAAPGLALQPLGDGWFGGTTAPGTTLEFVFSDGGDRWYPGGAGNNFRASWPRIAVRHGLLHSARPDGPAPTDELTALTLNLHTWQETDARAKLERVADLIAELRPDVVFLQECAQRRDAPLVEAPPGITIFAGEFVRNDNAGLLIVQRLAAQHGQRWSWSWSWAHYGWDVWEEGLAVLTPHPTAGQEVRWLSASQQRVGIASRKALRLALRPPVLGGRTLQALSVHTGWGADQLPQIAALRQFVAAQALAGEAAPLALIGGDFNAPAGGAGHQALLAPGEGGPLVDAYLQANPTGNGDVTMPGEATRIDYLLFARGAPLTTRLAQLYFKDPAVLGGRVSDHFGVIARFGVLPPGP